MRGTLSPSELSTASRALAPPPSEAGVVYLWLVPFAVADEELPTPVEHAWLSFDERERSKRFVRQADRQRFVLTRVLVRGLVGRCLNRPRQDLQFGTTQRGRPMCVDAGDLDFNVTHTRELIVVAIGIGARLGVDIENQVRPAPMNIASGLFAERENAALLALPPLQRSRQFYTLWTLKESFAKAQGDGLALPLRELVFELQGRHGMAFSCRQDMLQTDRVAAFWQFELPDGHVGALCRIAAPDSAPVALRAMSVPTLQSALCDARQIDAALDAAQALPSWRPIRVTPSPARS